MLTPEQQKIAIRGPCFALGFLVDTENREAGRRSMQGFSDAAIFHRWMSLSWTFDEAETMALLCDEEIVLLDEFNRIYASIPWQPIATHPFICDVDESKLERLIPVAAKLLRSLERPIERGQELRVTEASIANPHASTRTRFRDPK